MREEEVIENLHKTVLEATEVLKDLIMTNEALEEENKELLEKIKQYEDKILTFQKLIYSFFNKTF